MAELKHMGITFAKRGRSLVLSIGDKTLTITLDHIARKVANPLEAFSPDNLRALTTRDNIVVKEALVRNIKELSALDLDAFQPLAERRNVCPKAWRTT